MNVGDLVKKVIPASDREHRDGFTNTLLIDVLSDKEKEQLEDALINKLIVESDRHIDTLIVDTLVYLKSQKSLPVFRELLNKETYPLSKLIIATSIFELSGDESTIEIAVDLFRKMEDKKDSYYKYKLTQAFYYLAKLNNATVDSLVANYIKHEDYLVAYNAKRAMEIK